MSFEFSSNLSTVDFLKHLIIAWIIRKFIQLVNFVTFSVFYFFLGNRVWWNLYERTLSGNETSIIMHQSIETPTLWVPGKGGGFDIDPSQKASISLPPEAIV